jgi:beta-galactosidase
MNKTMRNALFAILTALLLAPLAGLHAAATENATVAGPLDSLNAVRSHVRIGAEIFLDPSHTREEIRMHFGRMKEVGLSVARMFIIWDHIERQPGQWRFDLYDQAYDAAAANGISVLTTLCPEDPPGWARQTPFYHSKLTLNTPEQRERGADYLRRVVCRYKDHPAQGPWSLQNEPAGLAETFDEPTLRQFGGWLKRKYGSVERVNERWFRPIESFEKVSIGPEVLSGGWTDFSALVDWKWFRIQQQSDHLAWVRDQVRLYDSKHPAHANPSALAYNMPAMGADLWSQKQVLDFAGTTIHASWQFSHHRPSDTDLGIAFITDLLRSGSGKAPWWVTELQSGLSLFGSRPFNPTAGELTRWLWDDVGAGAKGVIFWCWHPRRFGREGGEWGLVAADAAPTSRSEAVSRITRALAGPAAFLHRAEPLPARVAILYDRQSLVLGAIDERSPKDGDRVILSLLGCHRALCERQIPVDFINEDDLRRGVAGRYAVLYLPHTYAMDDASVAAVRRYVADGGTVWADGPIAWKDDYGKVRPEIPGGLTDVFGVKVEDILPMAEPFRLTMQDTLAGEAMRLPVALRGAEVFARDAAGQAVATRRHHGKGTTIFVGTALTLGYHRHPDPQAGEWITAPAQPHAREMAVSAATKAPRVFFRGMKCPEGLVAILTNPGAECRVRIAFRGTVRDIEDVLTARRIRASPRKGVSETEVTVPAGGVSVLLARDAS